MPFRAEWIRRSGVTFLSGTKKFSSQSGTDAPAPNASGGHAHERECRVLVDLDRLREHAAARRLAKLQADQRHRRAAPLFTRLRQAIKPPGGP
jgi:hypothetical protein